MAKRWRSLWWVLVVSAVVLLLVGVMYHQRTALRRELEAELTELRAQGRPVDIEDLRRMPGEGEDNAAIVYADAFAQIEDITRKDSDMISDFVFTEVTPAPADEETERVRELLAAHGEALRALEEGTKLPFCYFDANWEAGIGALLPHLGKSRKLLRLLLARVRLHALEERMQEAVRDTRTALRFCRHMYGQPTLISILVTWVLEALTVESIQDLCVQCELSAEELRALEAELAGLSEIDTFAFALGTERVIGVQTIRMARRGEISVSGAMGSGGTNRWIELYDRWRVNFDREELAYVRCFKEVEALAGLPFHEISDRIKEWNSTWKEKTKAERLVVADMLTPALGRAFVEPARRRARLSITRMGIAALLYRLEHKRWPEEAPVVFEDPFDGKPLRYSLEGDDVLIWTIDQDLTDDGGRELHYDKNTKLKGDIVWRLRPPGAVATQRAAGRDDEAKD